MILIALIRFVDLQCKCLRCHWLLVKNENFPVLFKGFTTISQKRFFIEHLQWLFLWLIVRLGSHCWVAFGNNRFSKKLFCSILWTKTLFENFLNWLFAFLLQSVIKLVLAVLIQKRPWSRTFYKVLSHLLSMRCICSVLHCGAVFSKT